MNAQETFTRWHKVRQGLLAALDKLTDAQLDFTPRAGLWSVRETVVHIAGTKEGWLRHYAANRWHENLLKPEDYVTRASLKTLLDEQHAATLSQSSRSLPRPRLRRFAQCPGGHKSPWTGPCGMLWNMKFITAGKYI